MKLKSHTTTTGSSSTTGGSIGKPPTVSSLVRNHYRMTPNRYRQLPSSPQRSSSSSSSTIFVSSFVSLPTTTAASIMKRWQYSIIGILIYFSIDSIIQFMLNNDTTSSSSSMLLRLPSYYRNLYYYYDDTDSHPRNTLVVYNNNNNNHIVQQPTTTTTSDPNDTNDALSSSSTSIHTVPVATVTTTTTNQNDDYDQETRPYFDTSTEQKKNIIIDMISIGSITRTDYQHQQAQTFGTHPVIRNFYSFNEYNDTSDPYCSTQLNMNQYQHIIQFCNTQWDKDDSTIRTWLRKRLKPFRYNAKKTKNTPQHNLGWLCAQKRPIDALQWLLESYRTTTTITTPPTGSNIDDTIPDYIVLIDDDTYINMDTFLIGLHNHHASMTTTTTTTTSNTIPHTATTTTNDDDTTTINTDEDHPILLGGCVYNFPRGLQFTFPHGGFGSIISKSTIRNLLRPIDCSSTSSSTTGRRTTTSTNGDNINNNNNDDDHYSNLDPFTRMACWRLYEQNHFGELQYFTNGMSVLDLMYNYTKHLSFLQVNDWVDGNGFCFHSDHALGYFLGFYHVAIPDHELHNAELSDNVRQQNQQYGYSEITTAPNTDSDDDEDDETTVETNTINSQCTNSYYEKCDRNDMICHYIQPQQMEQMFVDDIYYEDEMKAKIQQQIQLASHEKSTIDVISIGTLMKPQLQEAQERTFGSHPSIRHWFRMTELNDTDTTCFTDLTLDQVGMIYTKCKTTAIGNNSIVVDKNKATNNNYKLSRISELVRRRLFSPKNHTGWMCAQKRPIDGLFLTLQKYRQQQLQQQQALINNNNTTNSSSLPNYLVIIDDDTYMNMNYLMEILPTFYPSYESYIITGCKLIHPKNIQFTFPFGGFGTILTRRAIEHLLRPIDCSSNSIATSTPEELFNTMACWRLSQNIFGERSFFSNGMSVVDLLYAFSSGLLYTQVDEWDNGIDFCFHSDHALGYFLTFYHIAVTDEKWTWIALQMREDHNNNNNKDNNRMDDYFNDELRETFTYTGLKRDGISGCKFRGRKCTTDAPFCHYIDANQMDALYSTQMAVQ